jgi:hypothetical protein
MKPTNLDTTDGLDAKSASGMTRILLGDDSRPAKITLGDDCEPTPRRTLFSVASPSVVYASRDSR